MVKVLRENNEIKTVPIECIKGATLPSKEEAENLLTQDERICKGTREAINNGLWVSPYGYGNYWLRTEGHDIDYVYYVHVDGNLCSKYFPVTYAEIGIRPSLILNLKYSNFKVGDKFDFGGYTFKIVSSNMAICDVIVDACPFNKRKEDGNNYETSYARQIVNKWFDLCVQYTEDIANNITPDSVIEKEHDFGF